MWAKKHLEIIIAAFLAAACMMIYLMQIPHVVK
jgi:hypothetical protein